MLFVVAVAVAAICVRLGVWQLDRLEQRRGLNAAIGAALASEPVPIDELLSESPDLTYQRVTATGTWDAANEVILYGRSLNGTPGNHVLTPLTLADGRAVLVDRGWVPADESEPPVTGGAAASDGEVTVEGLVLPSDEESDTDGDGDGGGGDGGGGLPSQVRTVDVGALEAAIGSELVPGVFLLLERQTPPQERPIPAPLPTLTEGPHLSYAIQWFTFAAIALVGYGLLVRRGRRGEPSPDEASADGRD